MKAKYCQQEAGYKYCCNFGDRVLVHAIISLLQQVDIEEKFAQKLDLDYKILGA